MDTPASAPEPSSRSPFFASLPRSAIVGVVRELVILDGITFLMDVPRDSDKLLDHPDVEKFNEQDEYMPYWADIWPSARMLGKAILREDWSRHAASDGTLPEALEIGCGLGLPGIVALRMGLRVTFSDYDILAMEFAAANAKINGYKNCRTLPIDWRSPPSDLKVGVVLASDVIYESRNIDPLLSCLRQVLLPGGFCLMADQDRNPSALLKQRLAEEGFRFETEFARAGEPGGNRVKGTIYRIWAG